MEKSSNHLCELLSPCCLELISKSVVLEILRVFINIIFFSILIEIVSLIIFSVITYFYPSLCNKELEEIQNTTKQNVKISKSSTLPKSKISDIFTTSTVISNYDFKF